MAGLLRKGIAKAGQMQSLQNADINGADKLSQIISDEIKNSNFKIRESNGKIPVIIERSGNEHRCKVIYKPQDGYWKGGLFEFVLDFPANYPSIPYEIHYIGPRRIFHPNIAHGQPKDENNMRWGVCLGLIKTWGTKKRNDLFDFIFLGLHTLFMSPNYDDPLSDECRLAAKTLKENPEEFKRKVCRYMAGQYD